MTNRRMIRYREYRIKYKYEILLVSFFLLIFGDVFSPAGYNIMPFLVFQNVVASLVLFYGKKKWRLPLKMLLFTIVIVELVSFFLHTQMLRSVIGFVYVVYFVFLSTELYRQIWKNNEVSREMLSAVLSGFIILGLAGTYIFFFVEVMHPGSFANISEVHKGFTDLSYFSFISILGIGYGDIYPLTPLAKKLSLFVGMLGHFYNVIVIGIIIGKYIANATAKRIG